MFNIREEGKQDSSNIEFNTVEYEEEKNVYILIDYNVNNPVPSILHIIIQQIQVYVYIFLSYRYCLHI